MKKIILSIAAGFATLSLGLAIFYTGQFIVSMFQTSEQSNAVETVKAEEIKPQEVSLDELIYPKKSVQTETNEQVTETTEPEDESDKYGFDPTGEYYLIGGAKKGFQDFDGFYIKTANYKDDPETGSWIQEAITPEGYLYNEAGKELKFVRLFISEKHISFETVSNKGISYRFEGKFIEGKEVKYNDEKDYAVIEGWLIKIENGKDIARRIAHFGYVSGC